MELIVKVKEGLSVLDLPAEGIEGIELSTRAFNETAFSHVPGALLTFHCMPSNELTTRDAHAGSIADFYYATQRALIPRINLHVFRHTEATEQTNGAVAQIMAFAFDSLATSVGKVVNALRPPAFRNYTYHTG